MQENPSVANAGQLLELSNLLMRPQKKSVEWESSVQRFVSLAHVKTLSTETQDLEYFQLLILCKWAQKLGIRDTKGRNFQATRFREQRPPSLAALTTRNELSAALDLLVELRADWCRPYIEEIVSSDLLGKAEITRACDWAAKIAIGIDDLVRLVLKTRVEASVDVKLTEVWIKAVTGKASSAARWPSASSAATDLYSAILTTVDVLQARQMPKNLKALIWKLLLQLIEASRAVHPLILTEPSFISALRSIASSPLAVSQKKDISSCLSRLVMPTLSCLAVLIERGGRDGEEFVRSLIPQLTATFPDFKKRLNEATAKTPTLLALGTPKVEEKITNLEDEATSVYARLIPDWLDFYDAYSDKEKISVMNANLIEAARINGIELMERGGDVVLFDPILHSIADSAAVHSGRVKVVRPAVVFRRNSGSYRVVVPAIVSSLLGEK